MKLIYTMAIALALAACNPPPEPAVNGAADQTGAQPTSSQVTFAAMVGGGGPAYCGWTFSNRPTATVTAASITKDVTEQVTAAVQPPPGYHVLEWIGDYKTAGAFQVTVEPSTQARTVTAVLAKSGNG